MIPGGIADKQGNRYESKWLVRKLLDVLRGSASSVLYEGTADGFAGFEFRLVVGDESQWHQVKISNTSGNWTANRLKTLGVLDAFKNRLALENQNDSCYFISQDPANGLRDLSERARIATDFENFRGMLTKTLSDDFLEIVDVWKVDSEIAFSWLKRIYFRIESEDGLDESIQAFAGLAIAHDSSLVFGILRAYMEQSFNRQITTDVVRHELPTLGLRLKHWELDATLKERLRESTEDYLTSYAAVPPERLIPREETDVVVRELKNPDGAKIVLLTGSAGSGKSALVHQVIRELQATGVVHVALRADTCLDIGTSEDLGRRLTARDESPVVTLKGVRDSNLTVLVIDQVDAVSEVSGRQRQLKSLILRMLSDAEKFGTVKVVCACRSFDLDNDERLKALAGQRSVLRVEVAPLNWETQIAPLLLAHGIDISSLSASEQKLLALPLNLALYLEVCNEGKAFRSRNDLFARLLAKKARAVAQTHAPGWNVDEPLDALAKWMSTRQTLQATPSSLRKFAGASDILRSENLIVVRDGKIQFFHESLFDYLYARGFADDSQSLVELLLSDEQHLFRRTQVRQILESLREDNRKRYLTELDGLLSHAGIRFHIKLAVVQWLGALESPTPPELQIVLKLDTTDEIFSVLVRSALFQTPGWFDIANDIGIPTRELESAHEQRIDSAIWWLTSLAPKRPHEITTLLNRWYTATETETETENRAGRLLRSMVLMRSEKLGQNLLALLKQLLIAFPFAFFGQENSFLATAALELLMKNGASNIDQVISEFFRKWFELHSTGHPFVEDVGLAIEPLCKLAENQPYGFVLATMDALRCTVERIVRPGRAPLNQTFMMRRRDEQYTVGGKFFAAFHTAFVVVAAKDATRVEEWLNVLPPFAHELTLHIHLSAIAANPAALAHRLVPLLNEPRIFDAGWSDAPQEAFVNAVRAAHPHLSTNERSLVEDTILNDRSELDFATSLLAKEQDCGLEETTYNRTRALSLLNWSGRERFIILKAMGKEMLSPKANAALAELKRKFDSLALRDSRANFRSGFAAPTIPHQAAEKLSDNDWLVAIDRCSYKEQRGGRGPLSDSSEALAGQLHQFAKDDPARFAGLAERIPATAPRTHVRRILLGITDADIRGAERPIVQALTRLHRRPEHPWGDEIAHVIARHPALADDDELYEALCWYATHGQQPLTQFDFRRGKQPNLSIEELLSANDGLLTDAWSGTRGSAVNALSTVLQALPLRRSTAAPLIESMLEKETELSVRCALVGLLRAFFREDAILCAEFAIKLALPTESLNIVVQRRSLATVSTRAGATLLPAMVRKAPATGERLIVGLVTSEDEVMRAIGAFYLISASFYYDSYVARADSLLSERPEFNRLAAEGASEAIVGGELTQRALAAIGIYFDSPDRETRKHAAEVFRNVQPEHFVRFVPLARDYIKSAAFQDESFPFFHALGKATIDVTDLVILAAEELVNIVVSGAAANRRATDFHQLRELLTNAYATTDFSPEHRKRLLDVLDTMLSREIYGVDDVLKAHERD